MPAPKHVFETYIRATPEVVWNALVDGEQTKRYFYGTELRGGLVPGSTYEYVLDEDGPRPVHGTIIEIDPPNRLVMTFEHHLLGDVVEDPSRVTWELEARGPHATLLRLVHDDFHGISKTYTMVANGWPVILSSLKTVLETGDSLVILDNDRDPATATGLDIDGEEQRDWGRRTNGRTWQLLGQATRSAEEDAELLEVAYASAYHWRSGGTPVNHQRAEWLLSHAHARLGRAADAQRHADRCLAITEREGLVDFDRAYAYEAMARSARVAGDTSAADSWRAKADAAGDEIADAEDKEIFVGDLNG